MGKVYALYGRVKAWKEYWKIFTNFNVLNFLHWMRMAAALGPSSSHSIQKSLIIELNIKIMNAKRDTEQESRSIRRCRLEKKLIFFPQFLIFFMPMDLFGRLFQPDKKLKQWEKTWNNYEIASPSGARAPNVCSGKISMNRKIKQFWGEDQRPSPQPSQRVE